MAFTKVPTESKTKINKAGKILIKDDFFSHEYQYSIELANRWRACHAYPINTFQATLEKKSKGFRESQLLHKDLNVCRP